MATADNAELLALSGERSPYNGKLGVVETEALADLLLDDGAPVATRIYGFPPGLVVIPLSTNSRRTLVPAWPAMSISPFTSVSERPRLLAG